MCFVFCGCIFSYYYLQRIGEVLYDCSNSKLGVRNKGKERLGTLAEISWKNSDLSIRYATTPQLTTYVYPNLKMRLSRRTKRVSQLLVVLYNGVMILLYNIIVLLPSTTSTHN